MDQCLQNVINGLACSSILNELSHNKSIIRTPQSTSHVFDTLPQTTLKLKGSSVALIKCMQLTKYFLLHD